MDLSSRPVFIIGSPRSGTTWLYHILLSAGRFAIYRSETQIYSRFAARFGNFATRRSRAAFLLGWLESEYFLRSGLDPQSFYAKAMQVGSSPGAMLRVFMEEICTYQLATRWADCTPENALHLRRIGRDFPEALFIHVVRDGRDVALSLARQQFIRPFPWHASEAELSAGAYWAWVVRSILREARALPSRVLTLRYEDLVADTQPTLDRVADFVGQPIDMRRIMRHPIGSILEPNTSFADHNHTDDVQLQRWKTAYPPGLLEKLEAGIAGTLKSCGYIPATLTNRSSLRGLYCSTYAARFRAMLVLRTQTFLGRLSEGGLQKLSHQELPDDPTLRPNAHLSRIKEIVSGQAYEDMR